MKASHKLGVVVGLCVVAANCWSGARPREPVVLSPTDDGLLSPVPPAAAPAESATPAVPGTLDPTLHVEWLDGEVSVEPRRELVWLEDEEFETDESADALAQIQASAPTSTFSPYSAALGNDPVDARGHVMGSQYGDAYGVGGPGMFGSGAGGGGSNTYGYGLGDVGGVGAGSGTSSGSRSAPELRLGNANTTGGLSREVFRRIIGTGRGDIEACYTASLGSDPTLAGRVTVWFVVAPEGRVQSAEITTNETDDDGLGQCVVRVIRGLTFPAADGITVVTYPFRFQPDQTVVVATDGEAPFVPGPATEGELRAKDAGGAWLGTFPLKHTEVAADIAGYLARTTVEQTYENPYAQPIEAVYVFPLPAKGAVNDFLMEIGDRKIVGIVRPREEARRIYDEARARGQTASLLSQERPNVFTESVANIEPGGQVKIRLTYFERLKFERGRYEYVFPMVVGPRYIPGERQSPDANGAPDAAAGSSSAAQGGGGWSPPTDQVPDADRITPPVLRPGERSGHDIGLEVTLDAGLPVKEVESANHEVEIDELSDARRVIKLSSADSIPNRDFVLRWRVDGAETKFGVLAHRDDEGGFLTLMMQPPTAPADEQVTPREITFILDTSGSMEGTPIETSKAVVDRSLRRLRPDDRFNLFIFSGGSGQLWTTPRPGTAANLREARAFLADLYGSGGTEMIPGLRRALQAEHDPAALQMYVLLTDGYVGNEDAILQLVKEERGTARFFAFGIGASVNRYLIDSVGEFGGGASEVVLPREEDFDANAQRLFDLIDSPVLVDVAIDWNGLPVEDVYPRQLPDLFAGQTIAVVARYTGPADGTAYVTARVGSRSVRLPVDVVLPEAGPEHESLAPIWARWRIDELSKEMVTAEEQRKDELKRLITDLAVDFKLVSAFTSFVAVDESRVVGNGRPLRVLQPVELPEDVSYEGNFGELPIDGAVGVRAWGLVLQAASRGALRVAFVVPGSAADRSGIRRGAELTAVNDTAVHDLAQLEGLLLQASGSVRLTFDPGGTAALPAL